MASSDTELSLTNQALELAAIMRENASEINAVDCGLGADFLAVYFNQQFNLEGEEITELIKTCILYAITDLAGGADDLRAGIIGVQFLENKPEMFIVTHENHPLGTIIFRIAIKHLVTFQAWRSREFEEIPQAQLNYSVYYLISILRKFI